MYHKRNYKKNENDGKIFLVLCFIRQLFFMIYKMDFNIEKSEDNQVE